MKIQKKENEILIVPRLIESNGIFIDSVFEVAPNDAEYEKYLHEYKREQKLIVE